MDSRAEPAPTTRRAAIPLPRRVLRLVQHAVTGWIDDDASSMGAALAYYTLFSVAPLLLIVLAVTGLVFDPASAREHIFVQLRGLMGPEGASAVEALLDSMRRPEHGLMGTLIGVTVLVIGATTVFSELQSDLDRVWRAPARPDTSGLWSLVRARALAFGMVLAIGFLLLVSLILNAAIAAWGSWRAPAGWETTGQAVNFVISFLLTTAAFALIYKFIPRVRIAWPDVWVGATLTALLFTIGKLLIGLYIGKSGLLSGAGAVSSIVVMLVWVYYSAQVFLMGAELTWAYAHEFGSRSGGDQGGARAGAS